MDTQRMDDTLFCAWLDGELDNPERQAEHQQVTEWLRSHPEDAARVRLWAADRDALRARLGPMADEPVPEALRQQVLAHGRASAQQRWLQAAAVAGLVAGGAALGAALMWSAQQHSGGALAQAGGASAPGAAASAGWVQRAAAAHAVYVPEVRHPVEVNVAEGDAATQRAQEEHLAKWLTKRLAMPVKMFDLRAQGFELVGGRLLPDGNAPGAQLMYQNAAGQRVTVYLRKPEQATPAAFRYERQGDLGLFYWVEGPTGYALVGPVPREQLLALAEAIYQQGQAPAAK